MATNPQDTRKQPQDQARDPSRQQRQDTPRPGAPREEAPRRPQGSQ